MGMKDDKNFLTGWRVEVRFSDGSKLRGLLLFNGRNEILVKDDEGKVRLCRKQYITEIIGLQKATVV